jgi:site-specific DNA recombinase
MDTHDQHRGHRIHPHEHAWQVRVWRFLARCSGRWYCVTCDRWFEGECKCYERRLCRFAFPAQSVYAALQVALTTPKGPYTMLDMPTCVIYLRLSDSRTEEALDGRETKLRAEADRLGWIVSRVEIENDAPRRAGGKMSPASAFKRRAVRTASGEIVKDPDTGRPVMRVIRPGWQSVIADLKTGRASAVLAEDLDRACRDPRDLEDLLDACAQTGASARSLTGSLMLTNGGNDGEIFMARVMVAQAHKSSSDTGRRVRDAKARYSGQTYQGGLRPFGYAHVADTEKYHRTLMIVPDEKDMILKAVADILDRDITLAAITRDWRARGAVTVTGKPWTSQKLRQALIKPAVAGLAVCGGELKPAPWPSILERDTWEKLKAKLDDPVRRHTTGNEPKHLLSMIARCGICNDGTILYSMGTGHRGGAGYACRNAGWHLRRNSRHLDECVEAVVVEWLELYGKTALKPPPRQSGINAPALRAEAGRLRTAKREQMRLHSAGKIDSDDLAEGLREIRDRLAVIDAQLAVSDKPDPLAEFRDAPARAVWASLTLPRKRAIVRLLVEVTVYPTARRGPGFDRASVEVRENYPDGGAS